MKLAVDIGTSYTSACIVNPKGEAQSVEVATGVSEFGGKYSMPTAVLLGEDGELLLGQSAVNSRRKRPACYKDNFKRYLGQSVPVMLGEQSFQVEELYTQILMHIRECVKKLSSEAINELCLTYPATYENNRRELLMKAAADAGFSNVRLLDEPSAAAMCYLKDGFIGEGETLLVYDFGGGTFDVSIIRYMNGKFAVEKTGGLSGCGGSDMDREITKDIMECLKKEESFPKYVSREERKLRLQAQIEKMAVKGKHQLTNEKEFEEWFELGDDDCEYRITQERFNELVAGQVSQTVTECRHVLQEAGLGIEKLSKILMVGGTSRIPLVREMVTKMAGDVSVLYAPDLELAVAQGALYHLTEKLKTETEAASRLEEAEPESVKKEPAALSAAETKKRTSVNEILAFVQKETERIDSRIQRMEGETSVSREEISKLRMELDAVYEEGGTCFQQNMELMQKMQSTFEESFESEIGPLIRAGKKQHLKNPRYQDMLKAHQNKIRAGCDFIERLCKSLVVLRLGKDRLAALEAR